jgi:predicted lipoprotein with Yx(FWY)xxD motif
VNKLVHATLATTFAAHVFISHALAGTNDILADASGRTLYTFDKDAADKSNCNGGCATTWPPFLVKDGERAHDEFRVITRDDGIRQWALNEKPLYFFAADVQAGDAKGDGQGGVWHVIRAAGKRSEEKAAAATQSAGGYRPYGSGY